VGVARHWGWVLRAGSRGEVHRGAAAVGRLRGARHWGSGSCRAWLGLVGGRAWGLGPGRPPGYALAGASRRPQGQIAPTPPVGGGLYPGGERLGDVCRVAVGGGCMGWDSGWVRLEVLGPVDSPAAGVVGYPATVFLPG
jgi:hypothetical protein